VSASERQDEEQMPRETGTWQEGDPTHRGPTQRGGPHRGPTTGEGHTGDPHRTHTDISYLFCGDVENFSQGGVTQDQDYY